MVLHDRTEGDDVTARPQCARWFGPDNYCDTPVQREGDYCPVHDPDQSGPDEDFTRDGLLEELSLIHI